MCVCVCRVLCVTVAYIQLCVCRMLMDHVQKLEKHNNKLRLELEDRQADGDKLRVQSAPLCSLTIPVM